MTTRTELADLERAAEDLRIKMRQSSDIESFKVETIPDDLKIVLTAHMKDGSIKEREFQRKKA